MTQNKITENICSKEQITQSKSSLTVCPCSYGETKWCQPRLSSVVPALSWTWACRTPGLHEEGTWSAQPERELRYLPTTSPNFILQKPQPPTHKWQTPGMVDVCSWQSHTFTSHHSNTLCQYLPLKYTIFLLHKRNKQVNKFYLT